MKNTLIVFLLAFTLILSSCKDENSTEPISDGSTLDITPTTVTLTKTDTAETVDMRLSCGCSFSALVKDKTSTPSTASDIVQMTTEYPLSDLAGSRQVTFSFSPSSAPTGVSTVTYNFEAHKTKYTYFNSVIVQIEN